MTQTELLQEVLELIESAIKAGDWVVDGTCDPDMTIHRIKEALALSESSTKCEETSHAQPEQEPVAWESLLGAIARGWCHEKNANKEMDADLAYAIATEIKALYTTPPAAPVQEPCQYAIDVAMPEHRCVGKCQYAAQRQWVGLTDEEIPEGVLLAIRRAGLTLVMTAQGYHLMNLGPIEAAHGIKEEA